MNRRKIILLLTIIVVVVALILGYSLLRSTTATNSAEPPSSTSQPRTGGDTSAPTGGAGGYVDFSPTAIAKADGTVLLFFHATWCPSCRQIESEITSEGVPDGVTIIKVDYDAHQDLRQKYGVTIQTTFVKVDESGNEVDKFVPYGGDLGLALVLDALA